MIAVDSDDICVQIFVHHHRLVTSYKVALSCVCLIFFSFSLEEAEVRSPIVDVNANSGVILIRVLSAFADIL